MSARKPPKPDPDNVKRPRPKKAAKVRLKPLVWPGLPLLPGKPPKPVDAATREEIFRRFAAADPEPRGELEHHNPYTLLVAVVLSAQATDKSVNIATRPLFAVADNPAAMVALGEERVAEYIRTIGLYRTKARNVIALSRILLDQHGGAVPQDRAALESLPGVGSKTASVVLNNAFGNAVIAVDTHVFRVSHRIPLFLGRTPDAVQLGLEQIIPPHYLRHAHHWLILHGRYTCKARKPDCFRCVIEDLCRYPAKNL
jgi:endonuclease-3